MAVVTMLMATPAFDAVYTGEERASHRGGGLGRPWIYAAEAVEG